MKYPPIIRLRGLRQVVPSGYIMGRVSPGDGDAELIPVSYFAAKQVATGVVSGPVSAGGGYMDAGLFLMGNTGGVQQLFPLSYYPFAPAPIALAFPSAKATALAKCQIAPTTSSAFIHITTSPTDFQNNGTAGTSTICSFNFAAGAFTATVTQRHAVTVARGAFLYAVMDVNWIDTAIAYINIALPGDG